MVIETETDRTFTGPVAKAGAAPQTSFTRSVVTVFGVKSTRIGGVEVFARELSRQLGQQNFRSVVCFDGSPPEPVRRYLELPNVAVEVLQDSGRTAWPPTRELTRILRRFHPEILHLHFTGFLSPYPWVARLHSVRRIFFTDHGSHPAAYVPQKTALWKRVIGRALTWPLSQVFCVSDYNVRCMVARGMIPSERLHRIYNGVDLSRRTGESARFRQKHGIPEDRLVILQVSWIIPEKGILDLLEAARLILVQNRTAHLVIVGEGAYRDRYMAAAQEMGLGGRVTWTGLVGDPFAEGVYAAADVVCQLSRWQEAFPYVIAEAMACGKPIVASRVGGIPEVVADGESGFLVPSGAPAEAAEKLLYLLRNPELRERMGLTARRIAENKCNVERNVAELLRFYEVGRRSSVPRQ
jgi:L-malate glycosyltransferase